MNVNFENEKINNLIEENRMLRQQINRLQNEVEYLKYDKNEEVKKEYIEFEETNVYYELKTAIYKDLLRQFIINYEKPNYINKLVEISKYIKKRQSLKKLGGESFAKLMEIESKSGESELHKLLEDSNLDQQIKASAYTQIAKNSRSSDKEKTLRLAKRAWESDPRLFRLKWYAFQAWNAQRYREAEILFDLMDGLVDFSEKEKEIIDKNKKFAKNLKDKNSININSHSAMLNESTYDLTTITSNIERIYNAIKEMGEARTKEITFLLDCMDEQKQIIKKSSQDALLLAISKIRDLMDGVNKDNNVPSDNIIRYFIVKTELENYLKNDHSLLKMVNSQYNEKELEYYLNLMQTIVSGEYDLVIEFGSGPSTLYAAIALAKVKSRSNFDYNPEFISFSPDKKNIMNITKELEAYGEYVSPEIIEMPLKTFGKNHGQEKMFFDCETFLKNIGERKGNQKKKTLLIINDISNRYDKYSPLQLTRYINRFFYDDDIDMLITGNFLNSTPNIIEKWMAGSEAFGFDLSVKDMSANTILININK